MSEIKVGDRVGVIVYPWDCSAAYQVPGRVLKIRQQQSIGGTEYWADVEHDQFTPPFSVYVKLEQLTRLDPPAQHDDDWLAAVAGAGATK